ncbi:MAG: hypothetical protein HGA80_05185, partial [Candidatus Omnitrophica bacterium]|nr:hypothetical protein [Candidatus Omnitrophota bacterium]
MVRTSSPYSPVILRGLGIHGDNPLAFDFIVDKGETGLSFDSEQFHQESIKLVKYFLASLTVPEKAQWVNLSPYEKDHMLGAGLRDTGMGYDLLAQDYILKQLSASLLYPEEGLGREFWEKVYKEAKERFGITEIPHDAFNKVWIVPDKGVVYETGGKVLVLEQRLKVLLEQDYLATQVSAGTVREKSTPLSDVMKQVMREIVIPRIEKEVNEGRNFATLRQIYNSMILAV